MDVAHTSSSFTQLGLGINYRKVGSLLVQENHIFRTASMSKNYECPVYYALLHNWKVNCDVEHLLVTLLTSPQITKTLES